MRPSRFAITGTLFFLPLTTPIGDASGGDRTPEASRAGATANTVFHPESPFFRRLPDETPVAVDSDALIASLRRQAIENFGSPGRPNLTINTHNYTAPLIVADEDDPAHDIRPWNCQDKEEGWDTELSEMLAQVHIPDGMQPDGSSDGNVSIYNEDTGRLIELWRTRQADDGTWEACWGGEIEHAATSMGSFPVPYGASAGGLAMWGYTIRHQDLLDGEIKHVIGVGIPEIKQGVISSPAVRTDGRVDGTALAMGQMLRLPADLDLDSLTLSPTARMIAQAAQDYGLIVTDTSGAVALAGEHGSGLEDDRYDEIFRGREPYEEMSGDPSRGEDPFPLDALVALPVDYEVPVTPEPPRPSEATTPPTTDRASETATSAPPASAQEQGASTAETSVSSSTGNATWVAVLVGLGLAATGMWALLRRRQQR